MNELYTILSIYVTGSLLFVCGLMFLFIFIPANPLLANYRKARYMMAGAYLFLVVAGIMEYLFQAPAPSDTENDIDFIQTVTLAISVSQAFLFTFAMLALLEIRFPGWRYLLREAAYALLLIAVIITAYALCDGETFNIVFYFLIAIYSLLLVRYTVLFVRHYHYFRLRMDNYFSDMEAVRLRWVAFSFFAALAIGIMALLSSLFMTRIIGILFAVVFDTFYLYFAIRFINYPQQFQTIDAAFYDERSTVEQGGQPAVGETDAAGDVPSLISPAIHAVLEAGIEQWVAAAGFTQKGITIKELARSFNTNSKYLSIYINQRQKQTFSGWINRLRIERAKTMLLQYPEMSTGDISDKAGFADKSNFHRHFVSHTHCTPREWRNRHKE